MTLSIGSDHAGFQLKEKLKNFLTEKGHTILDKGTHSDASVDYADYAHPVAISVETGESERGILICGSANGVCITANKHQGIRAALCWKAEIAELARAHNDANIICLPARFITDEEAMNMITLFLSVPFEGGRHLNRIHKIPCK